jgi:hypothetical protein
VHARLVEIGKSSVLHRIEHGLDRENHIVVRHCILVHDQRMVRPNKSLHDVAVVVSVLKTGIVKGFIRP